MANGINLAEKYETQLIQQYNRSSIIQGKVSTQFSFEGVKTIHIYSLITQPLGDYTRSGSARYGTPTELQDDKQELTMTQDKAFTFTIDKGNLKDQMNIKRTGVATRQEIAEQVVPYFDKYAIKTWADGADTLSLSAAPTTDTVSQMFIDARTNWVNNNIPLDSNNFCYVPTSVYALLLKNPDFIRADSLNKNILLNGEVGKIYGWRITEVPDPYMPTGVSALFTRKEKVLAPVKINELKTHDNPPGISGVLVEGRYYGDAFVLKTLVNATEGNPSGEYKIIGVLAAKTA